MRLDIFQDENGNELKFYENDKGKLYLNISDGSDEFHYSGYITLGKEDAIDLAKAILRIAKQLPEND